MAEIKNEAEKAPYFAEWEKIRGRPGPDWVKAYREAGLRRFAELELPHRKQEAWRFTNVNPIIRTPFRAQVSSSGTSIGNHQLRPYQFEGPGWVEAVFVDGFFASELSRNISPPDGSHVGSLLNAVEADDDKLIEYLGRLGNGAGNVFTALNAAFLLDGAWIRIPKETRLNRPMHLLFVSTLREQPMARFPHNVIVLEPMAEALVVESHVSLGNGERYLTNAVSQVFVGEGARLKRVKLLEEDRSGYHMASTYIHQEKDSSLLSFSFFLSGRIGRDEIRAVLAGEGIGCSLNGLYLAENDELVDNHTSIEHHAPHCTSWIGYKGVLDGKSHAVFTGRIRVERGAQQTDSKQLNQNLLLSDTATVNTKPLLEIFADDVKCTHGATVGQPPPEQIFYFRTRGMSEAMARGLLTYAFAEDVVQQVPVDCVRDRLDKFVFDKYSRK